MGEYGTSGDGFGVRVFEATTSQDDWRKYLIVARRHLLPNVGAARAVYIVAGALIGVGLGLLPSAGFAGVVLLVAIAVAFAAAVTMNARYTSALRGGLAGELTVFVSVTEVTVAREGQRTSFSWSGVKGWSEDPDRIYMTVAPFVGWPLPKSGFLTQELANEFREHLAAAKQPTRL